MLKDCEDSEQAFSNWMERDAGFADVVFSQARELEMKVLIVDGTLTLEDNIRLVKEHFGLNRN